MCIFLPQSTDRHTEITANSKLLMGVNVRVDGCLSLYFRPFAAAPALQRPHDPKLDKEIGYMDGCSLIS